MNERYFEFEQHLMLDEKPSEYYDSLLTQSWFKNEKPFSLLAALKDVDQSPKHHPEGDVFRHTMMVVDEAAKRKGQSKEPREFMWAALLHDLGKEPTTKVRNGRITAYDHDRAGEPLALEFLEMLGADRGMAHKTAKLVRWHMQILFVANNMKFMNLSQMIRETDYEEVALLGLCDRRGRGGLTDEVEEEIGESIDLFLHRCEEFVNNGR